MTDMMDGTQCSQEDTKVHRDKWQAFFTINFFFSEIL